MEKEKLKNTDNGDFILKRKEYLHFFETVSSFV